MAEPIWLGRWSSQLATLALLLSTQVQAQTPAACPAADAVQPVHLYGEWSLELWKDGAPVNGPSMSGEPAWRGRVRFERHPEFEGNVRGQVWLREGVAPDQLAGDVTDGELVLDESADGQRIDAVWVGVPQDCARRFEGTRRPADHRAADEPLLRFRLSKTPGWR